MTPIENATPESPEKSPSPPQDWITAYCDGGSRGNPGPAGFGVHIEDDAGKVLGELSGFLGKKTNNFAEYSALLAALRFAQEHGRRRLRVVADSELMVKQMKGQYRVNSPELRPLYEKAKSLIRELDRFEIQHVLREKNRNADRLANAAMDRGMGRGVESSMVRDSGRETSRHLESAPAVRGGEAPRISAADPPERNGGEPAKMLRGFTRDGVVHLLGSALPDGIFVKVIPE
jgi:probable phosphoglycerate mutase